jgi:hypothetical protein
MNNTIASISLFLLLSGPVVAQSPLISRDRAQEMNQREAARDRAQKEWDKIRIGPIRADHDAIAKIAAEGSLRPSRNNTDDVLRLMESAGSSSDREAFAIIAGDLYRGVGPDGDKSIQRDVQESLSRVARNDKDPKVRKTAALTYSRLGYFPDSLSVLAGARPLLGDQSYHQQLAQMLLAAPADGQVRIIREFEYGEGRNNDLGKRVVTNLLRDENAMAFLTPIAVTPLLALLKKQEPDFGSPPESMGVMTISGYADWLNAVAVLTATASGEPPAAVVSNMVKLDGDPRKLVAMFDDAQIAALVRSSLSAKDLDAVDAKLAAFGSKYKSNENVQGFVAHARRNLAEAAKK